MLTGCEKDDDPTSVSLRSITREKFDYKGGLASAIVDAGGRDVTAESSESWCRTAVIGSIVNFNVLAYTGSEERSATVTVKAEGLKPLLINVVQDKFRGLVVVPSTLIFSDTDRTLSVAVTCSGVYDVKLTENPNKRILVLEERRRRERQFHIEQGVEPCRGEGARGVYT